MSFEWVRERPAWHARAHRTAIAIAVSTKALEGAFFERDAMYAGEQLVDGFLSPPGRPVYFVVLALQLLAAIGLLFPRVPRGLLVAAAIANFVDTAVGYQNTRMFLAVMFTFVALADMPNARPAKRRGVDWHLDATAWQLGVVYLSTVLHKLNPAFLSGDTLRNIPSMPDALIGPADALADPTLAMVAAWSVVLLEISVPLLLLASDRTRPAGIALALALHCGMAIILPAVTTFSIAVFACLYACLPADPPWGARFGSLCTSAPTALVGQSLRAMASVLPDGKRT